MAYSIYALDLLFNSQIDPDPTKKCAGPFGKGLEAFRFTWRASSTPASATTWMTLGNRILAIPTPNASAPLSFTASDFCVGSSSTETIVAATVVLNCYGAFGANPFTSSVSWAGEASAATPTWVPYQNPNTGGTLTLSANWTASPLANSQVAAVDDCAQNAASWWAFLTVNLAAGSVAMSIDVCVYLTTSLGGQNIYLFKDPEMQTESE